MYASHDALFVGDAAAESRWKGRDRCNLQDVRTWQAISFAHAQDGRATASSKVLVAAYVCSLDQFSWCRARARWSRTTATGLERRRQGIAKHVESMPAWQCSWRSAGHGQRHKCQIAYLLDVAWMGLWRPWHRRRAKRCQQEA